MYFEDRNDLSSRFDRSTSLLSFERMQTLRPWASVAAGGALTALGISRRSWQGIAIAAAGGFLVYRGLRESRKAARSIHVEASFTVNKPISEVYNFWRNFENLPRFMRYLRSVHTTGEKNSHWEAHAPLRMSIGWDTEITDERTDDYIVWRSLPGSAIEHRGSVQFRDAPFAGGTEVLVSLDFRPPAGRVGAAFARLFGTIPEQHVREDLRRFKQLVEAGEIPTTKGQPSGRRSPFVRMMQAADATRAAGRRRTAS